MNCPNCHNLIPDGSKFCPECGTAVPVQIREEYKPDTQYVPSEPQQSVQYEAAPQQSAQFDAPPQQNGQFNAEPTQNDTYNAPEQNYGTYSARPEQPVDYAPNTQYNGYNAYNTKQPPAYHYYQPQEKPKKKGDGLAIASLVLSICSFVSCGLTSLLGLIFGLCGLRSNKKGFAIAGTIISAVFIIIFIGSFVTGFLAGYSEDFTEGFREGFEGFYNEFY